MVFAIVLVGILQVIALGYIAIRLKNAISAGIEAKQTEISARLSEVIYDFVNPQEGGKPSKLAEVLQSAGVVVGSAAARSIMASINADSAHVARAANGVSDIIEAQQNPVAALLKGSRRGKGAAIQRLGEILLPLFQGKPVEISGPGTTNGNHGGFSI